jgi:hypothetical protein
MINGWKHASSRRCDNFEPSHQTHTFIPTVLDHSAYENDSPIIANINFRDVKRNQQQNQYYSTQK